MMRVLASRLYFVYLIGCSETRTDSARLMRLFSTALDTTLTANPPACRCCYRSMGQTVGRTDGRPTVTYTYPAAHTMRAVSATQLQPQTLTLTPNSSNYTVFLNTVENTLYFPR